MGYEDGIGYEDVIIDPRDERLIVGEYYYSGPDPYSVIRRARYEAYRYKCELRDIRNATCYPFLVKNMEGEFEYKAFLIKVEDHMSKFANYVPYDLNDIKDRNELRGKVIRSVSDLRGLQAEVFWSGSYDAFETVINDFIMHKKDENEDELWEVDLEYCKVTGQELLENFCFVDNGKPVGKERRKENLS